MDNLKGMVVRASIDSMSVWDENLRVFGDEIFEVGCNQDICLTCDRRFQHMSIFSVSNGNNPRTT